jgi:hypothetical protein
VTAVLRQWFRDRIEWPPGPWHDEPDRVEWRDPVTRYACLALRNWAGAWCGYVGVPPGHPWHGAGYDDLGVSVHGGLTFAGPCMTDDRPREERVCHVPAPGEPGDVWWFGFDCNHGHDVAPRIDALVEFPGAVYRDLDYVRGQCANLAAQIEAAADG